MSPSAPTGKVYCWIRVSSASQSLAHQRRTLKKAYPKGIFIESKQSGVSAKTNRDLMNLIDRCEPGDKIAALRMSRVARSMKTLCDFFEACREKSVDVDLLHEKIDSTLSMIFAHAISFLSTNVSDITLASFFFSHVI